MDKKRIELRVPSLPTTGLVIGLAVTRSRLHEVSLEGLPDGVDVQKTQAGRGWVIGLTWDAAIEPALVPTPAAVVVYEGEPPVVITEVWVEPGQDSDAVLQAVVDAYVWNCTSGSVPGIPNSDTYRAFFCRYEVQTNPSQFSLSGLPEWERKVRKSLIIETSGVLKNRLQARWNAPPGKPPAPEDLPRVSDPVISYLSRVQTDIMQEFFSLADGSLDISELTSAYEYFAAGRLADNDPNVISNAQPDTAFVYLFAEFAQHAIDVGIDTDVWGPLLPGLVRMQQLFAEAQSPVQCFDEPKAPAETPISDQRMGELSLAYQSITDLPEQMGINLRTQFPGGFC